MYSSPPACLLFSWYVLLFENIQKLYFIQPWLIILQSSGHHKVYICYLRSPGDISGLSKSGMFCQRSVISFKTNKWPLFWQSCCHFFYNFIFQLSHYPSVIIWFRDRISSSTLFKVSALLVQCPKPHITANWESKSVSQQRC